MIVINIYLLVSCWPFLIIGFWMKEIKTWQVQDFWLIHPSHEWIILRPLSIAAVVYHLCWGIYSINEYYYHLAFSILKYCKLKQSVVLKRVVQVTVLTQEKIWRPQDHGSLSCDILFFSFRGSCSFTIFYHVFCNACKDML